MSEHVQHAIIGAIMNAESPLMRSNAQSLVEGCGLRRDDFTDLRARLVWPVLVKLAAARRPCTPSAVFAYGRQTKLFSEGDIGWLLEMEATSVMVDRATFDDMTGGMLQASRTKSLADTLEAQLLLLRGKEPNIHQSAATIESALRDAIVALVDESSTGDMDLAELAQRWERVEAGEEMSDIIPTGIQALDDLIGGFYANLNMVIGAPSEGKSAFIATVIEMLLMNGVEVGVFGLEDGTEWIQRRHVAKGMGINARDVGRKPRDHAMQVKSGEVFERLAPIMRHLHTHKRSGLTARELLRIAENWRRKKKVRIIFIDHGGELDHSDHSVDENRLRIAASYRLLRTWAFNNQIPVVAVAHTRRKDDRDIEPRPPLASEVRDCSDIENMARMMLGVWSVPGEDFVRLTSAKVTEGSRYKTVKLAKVAGGVLLDAESAEVVDLFAEKMKLAKARKEQKDTERREAKERIAAEKEAVRQAKAKKPAQSGFGLTT